MPASSVQAGEEGLRFLLVSGKPLGEPLARYGPVVMNTQEQLQQAFTELREELSCETRLIGLLENPKHRDECRPNEDTKPSVLVSRRYPGNTTWGDVEWLKGRPF
jgi:hypothetical protein